ncbi:hypothetical protein Agub_g6785 [Astrephomene gubernaculifera]|uniref:Gamma-soluble NSF attachment protein n=1 Tax=Astrephomene gubernaculifera TaxID=47775 RepID=A0AAD3HL68_9CHLO|nr:hypothetical protein Agub_g6785 [Astrephomene gubernaculifera]
MSLSFSKDKLASMEKEAKELLKKAKGLTAPSLLELRFKPDWESAAPLLDRAALLYKQCGNLVKAIECYERAAHAQERLQSPWHAAKHYEVIAELSRQRGGARGADIADDGDDDVTGEGAEEGGEGGGDGKGKKKKKGGGSSGAAAVAKAVGRAAVAARGDRGGGGGVVGGEGLCDTARYFKMAADQYLEAGKATAAGEVLARAARSLEESAPGDALRLHFDALDVYESGEREAYATDAFRAAAAFLVKQGRWEEAVGVLMRFGAVCEKVGIRHSQCKAYLGAVVVWLWAGDAERAWHTFQDAMAVEAFASSEEAFAADALFEAFRTADVATITAAVSSRSHFKQLDHQIARLATRLPAPHARLRRMARKLNRLMVDPDPEEEEDGEGGGEEELL